MTDEERLEIYNNGVEDGILQAKADFFTLRIHDQYTMAAITGLCMKSITSYDKHALIVDMARSIATEAMKARE